MFDADGEWYDEVVEEEGSSIWPWLIVIAIIVAVFALDFFIDWFAPGGR